MAKHKHRDQDPIVNDTNTNASTNNVNNTNNKSMPFGIDPMQLMGLLGGNFDVGNMGNMLSSMNTNGFDLGTLGPIAKMMGLNLDNNFLQGNMNNQNVNNQSMNNQNNDINKNMNSNVGQNMKTYPSSNMSSKSNENSNIEKNNKKSGNNKNVKDKDANLDFLITLRSYVHPDRIKFIDKIIEAYKSGEFKEI